jgi:hypothetical protein
VTLSTQTDVRDTSPGSTAVRLVGTRLLRAAGCFAGGFAALQAQAFTIERAEARYVDQQYQFELVATLDAPVERVEAVLRDYLNYSSLDTRILDSKVLERPEQDVAILATTVRACFGPFCRNVKRVERVEEAPFALTATTDASRSDVKSGQTHTELTGIEDGTRVTYRTSIVPAFWIPAFVGRRLMLRTLEEATINMFTNVERIALESAGALEPATDSSAGAMPAARLR